MAIYMTRPGEMPDELRKNLNQVGFDDNKINNLMAEIKEQHEAHAMQVGAERDAREFAEVIARPTISAPPSSTAPVRTWESILDTIRQTITARALPLEIETDNTIDGTILTLRPRNEEPYSFQFHAKDDSAYTPYLKYKYLSLRSDDKEIAEYVDRLVNTYLANQFTHKYPEFTKGNDSYHKLLFGFDLPEAYKGMHFALMPLSEDGTTYLEVRYLPEGSDHPDDERHVSSWSWKRWPGSEKIMTKALDAMQELRERPARGTCRASHLMARLAPVRLNRCDQRLGRIRTEHFVIDCYSHPPELTLPGGFGAGPIDQQEAALLLPVLKAFGDVNEADLLPAVPPAPMSTELQLV